MRADSFRFSGWCFLTLCLKKVQIQTCIYIHTWERKVEGSISSLLAVSLLLISIGSFGLGSSHLTSQVTETSCNRGVFLHHQGVKNGCSHHPTSLLLGQSLAHKAHHAPEVLVSWLGEEPRSDTDVCAAPLTKTSVQVPASAAFPWPERGTP